MLYICFLYFSLISFLFSENFLSITIWLFQLISTLVGFMKENHHKVIFLLSKNCNFSFLLCNCGEICISLRDCLPKFPVYFVCKIHVIFENLNFYNRFKERGAGSCLAFWCVCVKMCSLIYNHIRIKYTVLQKGRHFIAKNKTKLYYNKTLYYNKNGKWY